MTWLKICAFCKSIHYRRYIAVCIHTCISIIARNVFTSNISNFINLTDIFNSEIRNVAINISTIPFPLTRVSNVMLYGNTSFY